MKTISEKQKNKLYHYRMVITICFLSMASAILAQEGRISLNFSNAPLAGILQEIKQQSGKNLLYSNELVDRYQNINIHLENVSLEEALNACLKGKNLSWRIVDEVIIIEPKEKSKEQNIDPGRLTQIIRGRILDLNTETPLTGANIVLLETDPVQGTVSDEEGNFKLENVPVGRQSIEVSFIGYNSSTIKNLYVISGKESVITVKLEERIIQGEEVSVKAFSRKDLPMNEMAQVGARSFSVEETEKYAGSIGDPARMASGYAGVLTLGTQVNDIVIRGNSTNALLWRMEGLRIPNPNHFGDMSSTGGTVCMLNNNVLGNSDFYTGAFPAEFGDAQSGIFDLKLRKGNQDKREYLAQIGFNGFELGAEGPFIMNQRASYIANYRYSTLGVFDALGLEIGLFAIPFYQDLSFNIDLPTKKMGKFSLFGLGGLNSIESYDNKNPRVDSTYSGSYAGFTGINHVYFFNENSSLTTSIGVSKSQNKSHFSTYQENILQDYSRVTDYESTLELKTEYKNKLNPKNYLKLGFDYYYSAFSLKDSLYLSDYHIFTHTIDINGDARLVQAFAQLKHRFTNKLSMVGGLHYQYSNLGDDHALEPRLSFKWDFRQKHSISLGGGFYSKMQPHFIYYKEELLDTANQIFIKPNINLKMTRSTQVVLGYDYLMNANHRIKLEAYYQYLYRVPVQADSSYLSLLNYGSSFSVYEYGALVNKGTGYNYGLELTLEQFLYKGFYYLLTVSLFESKYKGSDGLMRNSRFNNNIICNLLGGYEWKVGRNNTMGFDTKFSWARGERRIPLDYEASEQAHQAVYYIPEAYQERFKDYLRFDVRYNFRLNRKTSHTFSIDILNATNRHNHFLAEYDADKNDYNEISTLGIMPTFVWRWNF